MKTGPLSGYKTYVTGALAIIGFWAAWSIGEMELATAIESSVMAVLAMTIRHGVSTEMAKKVAPLFLVSLALVGCHTSPGGYGPNDIEYDYDWAQETYISTVQNLLIAKQANVISQEDWNNEIYPLIIEGDKALDAMESAVLADNPSDLNVKLAVFRSVLTRLKTYLIVGEPGASNGQRDGNTTTLTRTSCTGNRHLCPSVGRQARTARVPGVAKASSQGPGGSCWRGSGHLAA